jgi:arylsulfatase A
MKTLTLSLLSIVLLTIATHARRPNVILIMADDMGYECLAANGGETYKTPRLDQLAKTGIRFEHCHSQPICTPSRVQIMTGIYNNRNYIKFGLLDPKAKTFGHLFKDAGYKTAIAGKWQLQGGLTGPNKFGFDEYCLWQLTRRPPRFPNPGLEINGKEVDYKNGEYGPDVTSDFLCDFMEKNKEDEFFVYYPMIPPHWPFQPTQDSKEWNPKESREYPRSEWRDKWFQNMVTYTDKVVGKIVDKLETLELREDTLIIFTGDNGTYTGIKSVFKGKSYQGGKGSTKDNGTHVPLIVNWPGTSPEGKVSKSLVDFSDMLPTIAEVGGIEVPESWKIDGTSFASEIKGGKPSGKEYIYCWYERNGGREKAKQLVRNQRYKLYADGKFFDIPYDFGEKKPLDPKKLDAKTAETFAKLSKYLKPHVADTKKADPIQNKLRGKPQKKKKK